MKRTPQWARTADLSCVRMVPFVARFGSILCDAELPPIALAEQIMHMPAMLHRRWTEGEVRQLIDESPGPTPRYELVDGELLVTPALDVKEFFDDVSD